MNANHSRRTLYAATAGAAAVALAVVGCSPSEVKDGGGTEASPVELTLSTFDGGDDNKALEDIIAAFEAANPGITVTPTFIPEDSYTTKLQTSLLAEPPDIASPYNWDLMFEFTPLNDLVLDAHGVSLDDLNGVVQISCAWEGELYCIGTNVGSVVMFYNKAIFDEKGVDYPDTTKPLTFDEMADLAAQVTTTGDSSKDHVYGASMGSLPAYIDPANVLDETGRVVEITKPDFAGTLQTLQDMIQAGTAPSGGQLDSLGGSPESLFLDGKTAMVISDSYTVDLIEAAGLDYGIAPTPIVEGSQPWIVAWTNAMGIPRGAPHPEEAALFMAFLATKGQDIQANYGIMPAGNAAAEAWADTPERQQLVEVNSLVRESVFDPNQWAWNGPMIDAVTAAENGNPVMPALEDAEPKAQQGLDTTWDQFDRTLKAAGLG